MNNTSRHPERNFVCYCKHRECRLRCVVPRCRERNTELSVILPTYNEAGNIGRLVVRLLELIDPTRSTVVVVDDASTDGTQDAVRRIVKESESVVLLSRLDTRGIFSAIKDGIDLIDSSFVVFMDADFSHPPEMIPPLAEAARTHDIASASRYMRGGGIKAPFRRVVASRGLNRLCRFALRLEATDLLGGFHCMRRELFQELEFKYPALWGEFDLELFFRAKELGYSLKEIPFVYVFRDFGVSKSVDFEYGLSYLKQIYRLLSHG